MTAFNLFKRTKIDWVTLPDPDDSISFFETIKTESEKFWADTLPNEKLYGFQIQQGTKWKQGLNDTQLKEFENVLGVSLPTPLRNFYQTMNGLTKKGINVFGNDGTAPTYHPIFYSFPDDIDLIHEQIDWVCEATDIDRKDLNDLQVSRLVPICGNRFMLVDIATNPILSMTGSDIIYYAENLSKLLANEIFSGVIYNVSDFESPPQLNPTIKFWLD
jgi:hypothetical protein